MSSSGGRDVERRVEGLDTVRRDAAAPHPADLVAVALLDRDRGAGRAGEVERRGRRGHHERHAVARGEHRERVGADLVGDRAVGGDPVGAHDHAVDPAAGQEGRRRRVGQQGDGDAVLDGLPRGETRTLQNRPGLAGEQHGQATLFVQDTHDPEGRADAAGGQRPGVAVRHDPQAPSGEQPRAVLTDGPAGRGVVLVEPPSGREGHGEPFRRRSGLNRGHHPGERPREVDRRRPCRRQPPRRPPQVGQVVIPAGLPGQGIGRHQPDRRGTPDGERADQAGTVGCATHLEPTLDARQPALIQQLETIGPAKWRNAHGSPPGSPMLPHGPL